MVLLALVLAAATPLIGGSADTQAIASALAQRHGAATTVSSVLLSGSYAVARGASGTTPIHEGLRRTDARWRIVCDLAPGTAGAAELTKKCGFPAAAANRIAADEAANAAAAQGRFAAALPAARAAYRFSLPREQPAEAARVQLLQQLSAQMQTGSITRAEAIRKWNELRFAFYLP